MDKINSIVTGCGDLIITGLSVEDLEQLTRITTLTPNKVEEGAVKFLGLQDEQRDAVIRVSKIFNTDNVVWRECWGDC